MMSILLEPVEDRLRDLGLPNHVERLFHFPLTCAPPFRYRAGT